MSLLFGSAAGTHSLNSSTLLLGHLAGRLMIALMLCIPKEYVVHGALFDEAACLLRKHPCRYFCYCFVERCCLGGATGIATLYESKSYLWQNDKSFYPLDTLPEVLSFIIICWPAALAR